MAALPALELAPPAATLEDEVVAHFDLLRAPLLRYLASLGLPIADGEEIVQEVFLALFQHLRRGGGRANLRGWIFRVAHNLGLKRRNRGGGAVSVEWEWLSDPAPDPEQQFFRNESGRRLRAVVRALPEQDRRCLLLRAEGLRYREIGHALAMSLGAVSLSLARSLARIARATER
ncbi:MAG TPA: sigma-70 family RNA polymerase sigma factor [Bryobacteraceae bacterium]|jgi:RNA polymerase sigma-70 factor (ECF subfamily)|nr:sigma-70 family RNA polymerase sigma factor [Bryobacteraceae bacterium]